MGLPEQAIEHEVERFKNLTAKFRETVGGGKTRVGDSDEERERVYEILVQINEFLEEKLRQT